MLHADPEIAWLDGRHLRNWWLLALPPGLSAAPSYALCVLEKGRLVHAVHSGRGYIDPESVEWVGTKRHELASLRRSLKVDGLLVVERDALAELMRAMDKGLSLDDDYVRQGVHAWRVLRERRGIWSDPPLLDLIPPVRAEALQKTFDLLVPDGTSLVAYVLDDSAREVYSSVIALKEGGQITLATMHPAIADRVTERELARGWRDNYRRVNDAIKARIAPPSISVFAEKKAIDRILRGPTDQLARELQAGNIIVDPAPLWLQGLLGGAAAMAVASRGAQRVARFLPQSARRMASELAGAAQERLKDSGASPFALLGFDPIELLVRLREYYRR